MVSFKKKLLDSCRRIYQNNEDDFRLKFRVLPSFQTQLDSHKHGNKEKLFIKSFLLFTCKLEFWKKKFIQNQNLTLKVVFIVLIYTSFTLYTCSLLYLHFKSQSSSRPELHLVWVWKTVFFPFLLEIEKKIMNKKDYARTIN